MKKISVATLASLFMMTMFAVSTAKAGVYFYTFTSFDGQLAVPELSTWSMLLAGFAGLAVAARGRSARTAPVILD